MKTTNRPAVATVAVVLAVSTLLGCVPLATRSVMAVRPPAVAGTVVPQTAAISSRKMMS
jgi:hypothetical protein